MTEQVPAAGGMVRGGPVLVRSDGIEISPVQDGYVVYDTGRDRVHHLNPTAALVLELCTGSNTAADIGAALRAVFQPGEPIEGQIGSCIDQLLSEGLIQHTSNDSP
jgi:Coenzyme PQQ synthesis protein D (PqqD)